MVSFQQMFQISTTQTHDISLSCIKALCIYTPHNTCCETRTKRKKSNTFSPLLNVVFDAKEKKDKNRQYNLCRGKVKITAWNWAEVKITDMEVYLSCHTDCYTIFLGWNCRHLMKLKMLMFTCISVLGKQHTNNHIYTCGKWFVSIVIC